MKLKNIIIDSHCDTSLKLLKGNGINDISNQFTLNNALNYYKYIQFFAMYIEPEYVNGSELKLCTDLIDLVKKEVQKNSDLIKIITNRVELEKYITDERKKLGIVLTVEDGVCLEGNIDNLVKLYNEGIRVLGLTWNYKNQVGSGCLESEDKGLTNFGKEVVKKMNELGIIIDVSHLSEKSFYDVIKISHRAVIASHSCSKAICDNKRNLSDEQIKIISENGGMIGVNFYKKFLSKDVSKADTICLAQHIKHICDIGGKECVGLGSDYDGMKKEDTVIGLEDNSKLINLIQILKMEKFSDEDIERIMWKNQFEFMRREFK
jgi:membrane dipeptidase